MKIGVLALQGAVTEHIRSIERAGAEGVAIKHVQQLDELDGLILPGGESTTIGKLMRSWRLSVLLLQKESRYSEPVRA